MSMAITSALGSVAVSWVTTRTPRYAGFVALHRYHELDALFGANRAQAFAVAAASLVPASAAVWLLDASGSPYAARVLTPGAFALLAAAAVLNVGVTAEATYLRAHKREPFLGISLISAFATGVGAVAAARVAGGAGVVAVHLAVMAIIMTGAGHAIFLNKRREWHRT
jgi:hypothetical protein